MKIEVGKYYRTRDGRKVGPMIYEPCKYNNTYCWRGHNDSEGRYDEFGNDGDAPCGSQPTDLIAEWTNTPEVGTLKEIGAKIGDVVACHNAAHEGTEFAITSEFEGWAGYNRPWWRIITRAQPGPVREVKRKEIVPGVYGPVEIEMSPFGLLATAQVRCDDTDELTAAIDTLTHIRDAMEHQ